MKTAVNELKIILKDLGLKEEKKWGMPCFTLNGKNVVIIQPFMSYLAVLFFKGLLIKDPKKLLIKMGEGTHVGRQMRFEDEADVKKKSAAFRGFVRQAMKLEEAGTKVPKAPQKKMTIPAELEKAFKAKPALKKSFEGLTPGRQRGYIFFISSAKQAATRDARVKKCMPKILGGKGLQD